MYIMGMEEHELKEDKLEKFSKELFFEIAYAAWTVFLLVLIDIFIL